MKDKFVMTDSVSKAFMMVKTLIDKASRIDRIGLLYGRPGLGKSSFTEWYCSNYPSFYCRAVAAWSKSLCMMLEDMLLAFRVQPVRTVKENLRELIRTLRKHGVVFFIDEADRAVRKSILIESIRDLADLSKTPIILVGQESIWNSLQRNELGNFFSRITEAVEFSPLTVKDIQGIAKELCDLKCDSEVGSLIRTVTLGDFRLANALLMRLERVCLINNKNELTVRMVKEVTKGMPNPEQLGEILNGRTDQKPTLAAVA